MDDRRTKARIRLVASRFIEAGRSRSTDLPHLRDLAEAAGVHMNTLAPDYPGRHRPETLRRIGLAAGLYLGLPGERVAAFLVDGDAPEIEAELEALAGLRLCRGCGDYKPRRQIHRTMCKCRRCIRREQSPTVAAWMDQVAARLGNVPHTIRAAWLQLDARDDALTYTSLAKAAGLPVPEFRRAWEKAGLPRRPASGSARFQVEKAKELMILLTLLLALPACDGSATEHVHYVNSAGEDCRCPSCNRRRRILHLLSRALGLAHAPGRFWLITESAFGRLQLQVLRPLPPGPGAQIPLPLVPTHRPPLPPLRPVVVRGSARDRSIGCAAAEPAPVAAAGGRA